MRLRKFSAWIFGSLIVLIILLIALGFLVDEPLRRYMEREVNHRLKGYTVRIGTLNFHPIDFSLDLGQIVVTQQANPIPPVAEIRKFSARIQWRSLLHGRIVSDERLEHPVVYLNLPQIEEEIRFNEKREEAETKGNPAPPQRGWQDALKAIYPVKINHFEIVDGDFTYVDNIPLKQIHLQQIHLLAEDIRNVESKPHVYPSDVQFEAKVFNTGQINLKGKADFLAKPYIGIKTDFKLAQINLPDLEPLIRHLQIVVHKGTLSGTGEIELAPKTKVIHLEKITIDQAEADYAYMPTPVDSPAGKQAKQTAKEASRTENEPEVLLNIDQLEIKRSNVGFINKGAKPDYRIYVDETDFRLSHFSNHLTEGRTEANLKGKFMGSGNLGASATFRPLRKGPDLNLAVSIEHTDLKTMNDLLRAYGKFDVAAGDFSFFMEVAVREGQVTGYVKPLFKNLKVYDRRQDKEKSTFRKLYEGMIGGISKLLENRPRKEVATRADISGSIENPQSSTWQVLVRLIENAFFKAILPGFEKDVSSKKE